MDFEVSYYYFYTNASIFVHIIYCTLPDTKAMKNETIIQLPEVFVLM